MFGVHVSRSSLLLCFHCICEVVVCMTKLEFQYFRTGVSWNAGYRLCQEKGGQLLKIRSKEIQNVLEKFRPSGGWPDNFWVGVNENSKNDIIFDDCEPASSWTNWDSSPANDKPCVMLKKDDLTWINEVCKIEVNVMCEIPTGSCTYTPKTISCPTSGNRISLTSSSECQTHCEGTKDSNNFNCWAYKWDNSECTVYYSEDPYFCDAGSSASVDTYIRVCYEYKSQSLDFVARNDEGGDDPSSRACSSWDPPTTTTSTTEAITTTETQTTTESHTTTAESTTSETTTSVQTMPESQTTTGAQTTGAQQTETQTTSNQTISEIHHSTDAQTTPTVRITSETTTNIKTTQASTSAQTTPEAQSTTTEQQTATYPITITESSFERLDFDVCVCDFCGDRNKTIVENEMKEIVSKLKVDVLVLSATRRKKESQPDNRPSARNIGYLGIVLFVSVFGTIFILDIKKLSSDLGLIKQ